MCIVPNIKYDNQIKILSTANVRDSEYQYKITISLNDIKIQKYRIRQNGQYLP